MADDLSTEVELFGTLFVFMQKLTRRVDEELEPFGLTSRQWLLLAVLDKAFPDRAPTISDAAAAYGTSRQNVKQIALQLERRGWLRLERDQDDARAVRLVLTDQILAFQDPAVQAAQQAFLLATFGGLDRSRRAVFRDLVVTCDAYLSRPLADGHHVSSATGVRPVPEHR
jgi:DNA-binding MarR family transcriptional regulator